MKQYIVLRKYQLPAWADWEEPAFADHLLTPGEIFSDGEIEPDIVADLVSRRIVAYPENAVSVVLEFEAEARRFRDLAKNKGTRPEDRESLEASALEYDRKAADLRALLGLPDDEAEMTVNETEEE